MTEIRDQKNQCWGGPFSSDDDDDDGDDDAWSVRLRWCKNVSGGHWSSEEAQKMDPIHDHSTKQRKSEEKKKKNAHKHTHAPTHTHTHTNTLNLRRKYRILFYKSGVEVIRDDDPSREGRSVGRSVLTNVKSILQKEKSR
jgi:hypothetical protein